MADTQWVEDQMLVVARMINHLPGDKPAGHRGYWPDYESSYKELKKKVNSPVIDPDLVDDMLGLISSAPLQSGQRKVVWERVRGGKLRGWRKVGHRCGWSHEHCRNQYYTALAILADSAVSVGFK